MWNKIILYLLILASTPAFARKAMPTVRTGADQSEKYLPNLANKKVAVVVNQTSNVDGIHLVDFFQENKINTVKIFGPEHGFRGDADAGEKVKSNVDEATGISVISLYGSHKKPTAQDLKGVDVVVFDIQDVGARFYTYISTLQYVMEACAQYKVPLIVLDRPNPNGHYVDGPVLDKKHKSFVGMQSIPIVHGMTVGEYARMLNGESLLEGKLKCKLTVIPCSNYTHKSLYNLPIPPSPNLRTANAIALYPSLCLFEGTEVSVGRGTEYPFEQYGHPNYKAKYNYSFTPAPSYGSKTPPFNGQVCYGENLQKGTSEALYNLPKQINLQYLINAYKASTNKEKFFIPFFTQLSGNTILQQQIIQGKSEEEIRASWAPALKKFKAIRKKYLLYKDFE
jgi:uncharacterized protein YbbC (DUF1343 family)